MARQIAGSQRAGVPSPTGLFPSVRRGRRPHIDLNEIDRKAAAENAKNQAFQESRAVQIQKKLEAADEKFVPAAEPVTKLEQPVTKLEQPPADEWPDQSPEKPAAKKAVKKAANKAAKPK